MPLPYPRPPRKSGDEVIAVYRAGCNHSIDQRVGPFLCPKRYIHDRYIRWFNYDNTQVPYVDMTMEKQQEESEITDVFMSHLVRRAEETTPSRGGFSAFALERSLVRPAAS